MSPSSPQPIDQLREPIAAPDEQDLGALQRTNGHAQILCPHCVSLAAVGKLALTLDIDGLASVLDMSPRTIERQIARRTFPIPPLRDLGGVRRWSVYVVLQYLEKGSESLRARPRVRGHKESVGR